MDPNVILSVEDMNVKFRLRGEILHAIRGVSLDIHKGESLAIVGESGSGKSVFTKTFLGLLDANGFLESGHIWFRMSDENPDDIVDLATFKTEKDWLRIRGRQIAMVMQDPMTSLNPLNTIGSQIMETVLLHNQVSKEEAHKRAIELLTDVGIQDPERRAKQYPHEFSGGMLLISSSVAAKVKGRASPVPASYEPVLSALKVNVCAPSDHVPRIACSYSLSSSGSGIPSGSVIVPSGRIQLTSRSSMTSGSMGSALPM